MTPGRNGSHGRRARLYHRTGHEAAQAILAHGFMDNTGTYLTNCVWTGVWLSNVPLDVNEGAKGCCLLAVDVELPLRDLERYEWREEAKPYHEFLLPAAVVNAHAKLKKLRCDTWLRGVDEVGFPRQTRPFPEE